MTRFQPAPTFALTAHSASLPLQSAAATGPEGRHQAGQTSASSRVPSSGSNGVAAASSIDSPRAPHPPSTARSHTLPTVEPDHERAADLLLHSSEDPESPSLQSGSVTPQLGASHPATDPARRTSGTPSPILVSEQQPTRVRAQIACNRCRNSKIRCENDGLNTLCAACHKSNKECRYPPTTQATQASVARQRAVDEAGTAGTDYDRRRRARTSVTASNVLSGNPLPSVDVLDDPQLTPDIWKELFKIFQCQHSADLPFLHARSFLAPLNQPLPSSRGPNARSQRPGAPDEVLLAFLALTARFQPDLVERFSAHRSYQNVSKALRPSEFYAEAAHKRIMLWWQDRRPYGIEHVQAAIMLGLHDWGMCRGARAWELVGIATRAAQAIGLQYEDDLDQPDFHPLQQNPAVSPTDDSYDRTAITRREIRRRTFWSCFVMDRYLSSGKHRPQMLHAHDIQTQLPASDRSFVYAEKVRTLMLADREERASSLRRDENPYDEAQLEIGVSESLLSRYMRVLEIFGAVAKWSCAGGRRTETRPPWDEKSGYFQLRQRCVRFLATLPRRDTLTPQNTASHIDLKENISLYTLVHTTYLQCLIMLNREYLPFMAYCDGPIGPLDAPKFPKDKYDVPDGFWVSSARECFQSARALVDLVRACHEWKVLVESPLVGFAIYTVAFVGVYCHQYPQMDPDGFMCATVAEREILGHKIQNTTGHKAAEAAIRLLRHMRTRLNMSVGWCHTIAYMEVFYHDFDAIYQKRKTHPPSDASGMALQTRFLALMEDESFGGLCYYLLFERELNDFGRLKDLVTQMINNSTPTSMLRPGNANPEKFESYATEKAATTAMETDESGPNGVKDKDWDTTSTTPEDLPNAEPAPWNPINGDTFQKQPISTKNTGGFRTAESYAQLTAHSNRSDRYPAAAPQMANFRAFNDSMSPGSQHSPSSSRPLPRNDTSARHTSSQSTGPPQYKQPSSDADADHPMGDASNQVAKHDEDSTRCEPPVLDAHDVNNFMNGTPFEPCVPIKDEPLPEKPTWMQAIFWGKNTAFQSETV